MWVQTITVDDLIKILYIILKFTRTLGFSYFYKYIRFMLLQKFHRNWYKIKYKYN